MLNVVCVNQGNYLGRGEDYTGRLQANVKRHLSIPHRFEIVSYVDGAPGWWAKLALFQPGRFKGRCLYFDLDTVPVASLDDLAKYDGPFAALSDFYNPQWLASGVMAWDAGEADAIWSEWVKAGRPMDHRRGDGGWIDDVMPHASRLQDIFPGQLVSFKAHVCSGAVTKDVRAVCFHGLPRPHQVAQLMAHW